MTLAAAPLEDTAAPDRAHALAAVTIRGRHGVGNGLPEPAPVWQKLSAILPWLDRARGHCVDPPPHAAKASEWLLDNEFQVRRAIRQVREDLPTVPTLVAGICGPSLIHTSRVERRQDAHGARGSSGSRQPAARAAPARRSVSSA